MNPNCNKCAGCQWKDATRPPDAWCGMFREQPEALPCAQHDDFAAMRRIAARKPSLAYLALAAAALADANKTQ